MDFNRALRFLTRSDLVAPGETSADYSGGWYDLGGTQGGGEIAVVRALGVFRSNGETATTKVCTLYVETSDDPEATDGVTAKDVNGDDMTFAVDGDGGGFGKQAEQWWTVRLSMQKRYIRLRADLDPDTTFVVGGSLLYTARKA